MALPRLMVIGAAKCGTTTLHHDLASNPAFFIPAKQPAHFGHDRILSPAWRDWYRRLFAGAAPGQVCGVVSPMCATRPGVDRVPERARTLLGAELQVVYIVRDPLERAISHHHDHVRYGDASVHIDRELVAGSPFVDQSRYAMQLDPWLDTFGPNNVMVLHFETYVQKRRATIAELSAWLGVEPHPELVDETIIHNRGEDVLVMPWYGMWPPARRLARRLVPERFKQAVRQFVPRRRTQRSEPSPDTLERARALLVEDTARFHSLLGLEVPLWGQGSRTVLDSALLRPAARRCAPVGEEKASSTEAQHPAAGTTPEPG